MDDRSQEQQIQAVRDLTAILPKNDMGLPVGIYRTDLLPFHSYIPPKKQNSSGNGNLITIGTDVQPVSDPMPAPEQNGDIEERRVAGFPIRQLEQAFVWLQYDEGFPALQDGRPFWDRLDFEPNEAYQAFQRYLTMHQGVMPSDTDETDPDESEDENNAAHGTRSVTQLALSTINGPISDTDLSRRIDTFKGYFHIYYWGLRAQSYDMFRVAQYRKQQELRAIETQDDHYIVTRKLRHRLMQYMDNDEEFWDMMTPKIGIDMFKTLTQLERVSAGMPAGGPLGADRDGSDRGAQSFEVAFRNVAQKSNISTTSSTDGDTEILDKALEDPNALEVLQELIIKVG